MSTKQNQSRRRQTAAAVGLALLAMGVVGAGVGTVAFAAQGVDPTPTAKAQKAGGKAKDGKKAMPGMNMSRMVEGGPGKGMIGMSGLTAQVPKLKEKGVTTVKGDENWDIRTGFGRNAEVAGMMIQMMTEGVPGMGKMKMGAMTMDYGPRNFTETPDEKMSSGANGTEAATSAVAASAAPDGGMKGMAMGDAAAGPGSSPLRVTVTPNPPVRGDNVLDIRVTDAAGKPATGLKLSASVEMTSMDMGVTKPAVRETGNGHYAATVNFSMNGPWRVALTKQNKPLAALTFQVGAKRSWAQTGTVPSAPAPVAPASEPAKADKPDVSAAPKPAPAASGGIQITAKVETGNAAVGDNKLLLTVLDGSGKPVTGAKVTASVEMTSMDMGVTKPAVKEMGAGVYATTANFSMSGPWKVTVRVSVPGQPVQVRSVPVTVKRK